MLQRKLMFTFVGFVGCNTAMHTLTFDSQRRGQRVDPNA